MHRASTKVGLVAFGSLVMVALGLSQVPGIGQEVRERRPAAQPTAADTPFTFRARDVLGMPVRDSEGNEVGAVEDLVIDGRTGQVNYAVLSYQSFRNREQWIVMPWTILQTQYGPDEADRYIVLDIDNQRVMQAPRVTRTQWPQVVYTEWPQWQPKIDAYYETEIKHRRGRNKEKIEIKEKRRVDDD